MSTVSGLSIGSQVFYSPTNNPFLKYIQTLGSLDVDERISKNIFGSGHPEQVIDAASVFVTVVSHAEAALLESLGLKANQIETLGRSNGNFSDNFRYVAGPEIKEHPFWHCLQRQLSGLHHLIHEGTEIVEIWKDGLKGGFIPAPDDTIGAHFTFLQQGFLRLIETSRQVISEHDLILPEGIERGMRFYFETTLPSLAPPTPKALDL